MARKKALNALGVKERKLVLPIDRKNIIVYEVITGKWEGFGVIQCSMYPNFAGLFPNLETAIDRAHKIKRFHERQLNIQFTEK